MIKKVFLSVLLPFLVFVLTICSIDVFQPKEIGNKKGQIVKLDDVDNCRQLGGYQTLDGKTVKSGVLLRSGKLSKLDYEGTEAFYSMNITEVIDLRIPEEINHKPDPALRNVKTYQINLADTTSLFYKYSVLGVDVNASNCIDIVDSIARTPMNLGEMYIAGIIDSDYGQKALHEIFKVFVNHKSGAILWHCSGGKDRTGIVAALLLSALNVDRETTLNDYELTNDFVRGQRIGMKIVSWFYSADEKEEERVATIAGVEREFMEKTLSHIDKKYGSPVDYLTKQVGLSKEDIMTLKQKYLE